MIFMGLKRAAEECSSSSLDTVLNQTVRPSLLLLLRRRRRRRCFPLLSMTMGITHSESEVDAR